MKRSADQVDAENPVEQDKKKRTEPKLCPRFCEDNCRYRGNHNELILSLVNLQDSKLEAWKKDINEAKESRDLNQPLEDPSPNLHYPLLHWAAMLGKVKAVTWLLQQEFISLSRNPEDLAHSLSNVSNETVLFSMARFVHEGVESRSTGDILDKYFVKILDVLLKHDPKVLLVQEGDNRDTVLHLCARREEDSTAPFFDYLKRILGKLEEFSEKKDSRLPLRDILEARNEKGDAFIHLLARGTNPSTREDARKLIDFAKDKFRRLGSLTNADEKTVEDIWKEFKPNPEVYQTSSQEIYDFSNKADEEPSQDHAYEMQETAIHGPVGTNGDQRCPGGSEENIGDERLQMQSQGLLASQYNTGLHPEVQRDSGRGVKVDDPEEGIPPQRFQEPVSDKSSYLQSVVAGNKGQHFLQTKEPDDAQESDLRGAGISSLDPSVGTQPGSNTDTQSKAQESVRNLIHETELELSQNKKELERKIKVRDECEEQLKRHRAEVERLQVKVDAKEKELNGYNTALQALLN